MKKNRNTFFQEAQMSSYNYYPNQNMNLMGQGLPTQASQSSQTFYAGPTPMIPNQNNQYSDTEARLARLERQMNRLESRISKLEGSTYSPDEYDSSTNMYMV